VGGEQPPELNFIDTLRTIEKSKETIVNRPNKVMSPASGLSVVVIKRGPIVEADKTFSAQLQLINFSDGTPYESLHSIVSNAVAPYFKSFLRVTGKADRDGGVEWRRNLKSWRLDYCTLTYLR